jgi:putative ABC transport system permease protein
VKYYNENTDTTVTGAPATYLNIRSFDIASGRGFTSMEENRAARVAVLGASTAELLFGTRDPLGERIRLKNVNVRVIGVLEKKGDQGWFNPDDMVLIPYLTAMKQILGRDHLNEIDVSASEDVDLNEVEKNVEALLRKRHRIGADDEDDFHVRNQAEMIEMASSVSRTISLLLGGIASISLLVGGIGIMNIMLVTVTERTREIGVRKAIGARDRDILRQFLLESILMTGLGGLLGIAIGFSVAEALRRFTELTTVVEPLSVILALGVSTIVGVFFGLYPAWRAARLDPIEALRYE